MEERRRAPRFPRQLEVRAGGVELLSTNVSLTGMQLTCPAMRVAALRRQIHDQRLAVSVRLPGGAAMVATCHVVYVAPWDDEHLIGLHIETFEETTEQTWEAYLAAQRDPL